MAFAIKDILRLEVAPALGCTEPVAIALGAASAASLLDGGEPESIEVWVDPNIYKNGMAVLIPGTGGLYGLDLAAALGALGGDATQKMEVLSSITPEVTQQAQDLLTRGVVKVNLLEKKGLRIKTVVKSGGAEAESLIVDHHDNIVSLKLNGEEVAGHPLVQAAAEEGSGGLAELENWLTTLSMEQILGLLDELDESDLKFIERGITYNLRLSEHGLRHGSGMGVGKSLDSLVRQRLVKKDMIMTSRILCSSAADARMGGVKLPAMSSAGSGNHGLTAVLPLYAVKEYTECSHDDLLRAVALSHIVTAYVKTYTGRLSAVCGCSVAAGAGAAAGVTYMLGGDLKQISAAVNCLISELAGVICDGAKLGCALKLATAAGTAVQSALLALQGAQIMPSDGIVDSTMEKTARNLGLISVEGMMETDRTILGILMTKFAAQAEDQRRQVK
ncbi:MAG: L-serine ammonia-lyase, iron-sulfur-dependent, subunit alpha [Desulfarculaceae bacterium]|nr:L-serine ammonia-lyase, iron-sulfur-dependent, subunit alpha [Desulfarculaceae bacterium]MCF8071180.1 L-serine ammonia-lyase, iron-sulfur-dependent, subunit alpha [Desulfarculaceae bacterium]MCF8101217.1 L-serine ammonia-lyase, iron-sulfur-dependent, subunit alpha [Desulfarculaceae bacterium]MCF8115234.1 L-serine ammonia-lyase, iron-sulfur-dependent, subunit alpha [Desulfarculaceae bacterium]